MSHSLFAPATCPECNTDFDRLPVDRDEDGAYAALPVKPCTACGKCLCPACDRFHCDGCGDTFCADHLVSVPDGTDRPLHCCQACADECEPCELPAPKPVVSEHQREADRLAAMCLEAVAEWRRGASA